MKMPLYLAAVLFLVGCACAPEYHATGDLGVVIERADGRVQIVNTSEQRSLGSIGGLGDLSHASVVFSRDEKFAYVFGRDGGLSKIDITQQTLANRIIQGGNSIGGAISQDGRYVAVSNYEPGGVKIFDAQTLELKFDIPATALTSGKNSKVVGLADAPDNQFLFSLFDSGEIWRARIDEQQQLILQKYPDVGRQPYDALMAPDGRFYIAGLFGEDGMAKLDLWQADAKVERILPDYGKGEQKLPVYKMPHLEGWAIAGNKAFVPAVGEHQVLVVNTDTWQSAGKIAVAGQPVFVMSRPDHRYIWVNFAYPDNQYVQVIDALTQQVVAKLEPGPGVLHMEFTPRGEQVWVSVRDKNEVHIYDTRTLQLLKVLSMQSPSGIFFTNRAHKIGL